MFKMTMPQAVLFDLDGTLLDTIPDLAFALNRVREEHTLPPLSLNEFRPIASLGSKALIQHAFGIEETNPLFSVLREKFLTFYGEHLTDATDFFPNMDKVLTFLTVEQIPWGIVTNKLTRFTTKILKGLNLYDQSSCVICGDTLTTYKPHPAPLLYACQLLKLDPKQCVYIGDAATDVTASKAAGIQSLVALYGYIGLEEDPYAWQADGYVHEPLDIIEWLIKYPETQLK